MAVASDLKEHGHDVFILEVDPEQVARFQPHVDVRWIVADACEVSSLQAAGMAEVDVMVAATGDDEDNLVISLLSKQEFAVPRVIARVNNASNQWLFTESWGVDVPVSTPQLYTALVEEAVSIGSLVHLMSFEGASAHLLEVTLAEDSPSLGKQYVEQCARTSRRHSRLRAPVRLVPPRCRHRWKLSDGVGDSHPRRQSRLLRSVRDSLPEPRHPPRRRLKESFLFSFRR